MRRFAFGQTLDGIHAAASAASAQAPSQHAARMPRREPPGRGPTMNTRIDIDLSNDEPCVPAPHDPLRELALHVVGRDTPVTLADGRRVPYLNLDNAASTPALREVLDAVVDFMPWYSSVHRGAGQKSRRATAAYEDTREAVTRFVGASTREHMVIFGRNTTEAINVLAARLGLLRSDVVLVSTLDHHSNDLPWRARAQVARIGADAEGRLDEDHVDDLLRRHAGRVKLVAVTGASNVTGHMPRIHHLAERAHAAGARIFVDAAQLAPHRAIDMRPLADPGHIDYLALSAHKMYAPFGCGALIARRDGLDHHGAPLLVGGGTVRHVGRDTVDWADGPDRDEAGSPNVVGAVALAAALRALSRVGMDAVAAHEAVLVAHALRGMRALAGLRVFGDGDPARARERTGVIPFAVDGVPHALVAAILAAEHGIGTRNGCFCAQPYLAHLLDATPDDARITRERMLAGDHERVPGLVRASFGLYNDERDVDRLLRALAAITRGQYRRDYRYDAAHGDYACAASHEDERLVALGSQRAHAQASRASQAASLHA